MDRFLFFETEFQPSGEEWIGNGGEREVAVLMSGGVDSSVAALWLLQGGGGRFSGLR